MTNFANLKNLTPFSNIKNEEKRVVACGLMVHAPRVKNSILYDVTYLKNSILLFSNMREVFIFILRH
jgi:hypothetical protein